MCYLIYPFLTLGGCQGTTLVVSSTLYALLGLSALYLFTWDEWDEREHRFWQGFTIYIGAFMMIVLLAMYEGWI